MATTVFGSNTSTTISYWYTPDYRVDVLLDTDIDQYTQAEYMTVTSRWNYGQPLGTSPGVITYSFMTAVPNYPGEDGNMGVQNAGGFSQFTAEQKAAARAIFTEIGNELGIHFQEVTDTAASYGQVRLGANHQSGAGTAGYTWLPNSGGGDGVGGYGLSGDVWIASDYSRNFPVTPGSEGYATLVHEIGHALGLKHPGNYNAGESASTAPGNFLGTSEDNTNYSVMSYNDEQAGGQWRDWYGTYDLLALKALYGVNPSYKAGDTSWQYTDLDGRKLMVIDDRSGFDTVDLSKLTLGATVDLHPGAFSSIGRTSTGVAAQNNLSIDFMTAIERVVATPFEDHIALGGGVASADGGAGIDTAAFALARSAYQVNASGANLHVTALGIDDSLSNIERLQFSDGKFAFDFMGSAGETAKILGAVFGQGASPNAAMAGLGLYYLDEAHASYEDLMQGAVNAVLGANHTHEAFVNLVYTNVAGFAPSADVLAFWTSQLDANAYTEGSLGVQAAETSYNAARIDLVGQAQHGLAYIDA